MKKLQKKKFSWEGLPLSALSLVMAILLSAIIMAICGYSPFKAFSAIFVGAFGSLRGIANTLVQATPLIFTGLAFTFAKKANLINLGVEGQMYMGALGAALIGTLDLGIPPVFHVLLAVVVGFLFGAAFAAVIGVLKVKFGSNEVVAGVMLNTIATCIVSYLLNGPMLAEGSTVAQTERVMESARLPRVFPQYQLTIAIFFAVLACVFIKWFIQRSTLGYEIRNVGINRKAAETAGISIGKVMILAMCISGGIAGLAGVNQVLGVDRRLLDGFSPGYGFNGIAVAALAADNPLGVMVAGFIFGVLRTGAIELNRSAGIPTEFVDVIQAMVVIFVAAPLLVKDVFHIDKPRKKSKAKAKEA